MVAIPFGPFRPDAAAVNTPFMRNVRGAVPGTTGFRPISALAPVTNALPSPSRGAAVPLSSAGAGIPFAGTADALFRLAADAVTWNDVSRTVGGAYSVPAGERWRFAQFGQLLIAVNSDDDIQKFDLTSGTNFEALGGSPPVARYIAVVADAFVVVANLVGNSNRVQWSGTGDAEFWTVGQNSSDFQDLFFGGPIQGIVGGEQGYIFQRSQITRMLFSPGSAFTFQFDVVESERGLLAPNTLVQVGQQVFFLNKDGFYVLNTTTGTTTPIGSEKVDRFFFDDIQAGTELSILGSADPVNRLIFWAYVSNDNAGTVPDRVLIYDWSLGEWGADDEAVEAFVDFISQTISLDNLGPFGTLDTLPFSLDSPFWESGSNILGVFGADNRLSHFTGVNKAVTLETSDAELQDGRIVYVSGIEPVVDSAAATVAVAARRNLHEPLAFGPAEAQETNGVAPQHAEGQFMRARVEIPAGQPWTRAEGLNPIIAPAGQI